MSAPKTRSSDGHASLEAGASRRPGSAPGFCALNWIALGLMVTVDLLFAVALLRTHDLAGLPWFLVPYALGLTVGVAVIRPRLEHQRAFALHLSPVLVQIVGYLLYWGHEAGLWPLHASLDLIAHLLFLAGFALALLVAPYARRHWPLTITECAPVGVMLLAAVLR